MPFGIEHIVENSGFFMVVEGFFQARLVYGVSREVILNKFAKLVLNWQKKRTYKKDVLFAGIARKILDVPRAMYSSSFLQCSELFGGP